MNTNQISRLSRYNSVIYLESAVNAYQVTAVTTGFLPPTYGDWSPDQVNIGSALTADFDRTEWEESLKYMQHNTDQLTNLSNHDCISAYGSNLYQSDWGNVLLVTNATAGFEVVPEPVNDNYTVIMALENTPNDDAMTGATMNWLCGDVYHDEGSTCSLSKALDQSSTWHLWSSMSHHAGDSTYNASETSALVKYCLAEKRASPCSVQIASPFLTVVVLCNLVKLACIVVMLYRMENFQPLLSVGDAIASFLYEPDTATTAGCVKVRKATRWTRWGSGANPFRRHIAIPIFLCPLAIGVYFFYAAVSASSRTPSGLYSATYETKPMSWTSQGLSTAVSPYQLSLTTNGSVLHSLLLINLPQLIVTLVVLYYNHLITLILVGAEAAQFAVKRAGLRVSSPRQDTAQRSTYWLQLPFRYVIPLLTLTSFMHWALGRSIFLIHFQVYGPLGTVIPESARTTAGYSAVGILITLVIGAVLILALMVLGLKRLPEGAPVLESSSLAISAACHAPEGDEKAAEKEVMYGVVVVVNDYSISSHMSQSEETEELATFTSWDIRPAVKG